MSSFVTQSNHVSVLLSSLLAAEKDTRSWLQAEMERLVDPMLHSIFNRLTYKLVNADLNQSGHGRNRANVNCIESPNPHVHHSATFNTQPSNSIISTTFNAHCHQSHSIGYEPEFDPEILAQVKLEIKEEENEMTVKNVMDNTTQESQFVTRPSSTDHHQIFHKTGSTLEDGQIGNEPICDDHQPNGQVNNATDNDTQQDWGEHEIEEGDDAQMMQVGEKLYETNNQLKLISSNLNQALNADTSLSTASLISNKQSNHNLTISEDKEEEQVRHDTQQLSGETNNAQIVQKEAEKDNNGEKIEVIELDDDEEDISPQVKRHRQTDSATSSSAQFITHTLQCPLLGCGLMFTEDELTKHMWDSHSIRPFRCLVKNCGESFNNTQIFGQHQAQSHQSTTQMHCGKCDKHYFSYNDLSVHNNQLHQLGQFQCSFPACTFTGEFKRKVTSHYIQQHKQTLKCQHSGCQYQTPNASKLKQHQRTHLGIKPYRCKWPQCEYASARSSTTIVHIRQKHLARNPNGAQLGVPSDYVEEVRELLL